MSASLDRLAFYSRCPVWPIGVVSLITKVRCSRNVPCIGYMSPPVVVQFCLLLAHLIHGWGWHSGWLTMRTNCNHSEQTAVQKLTLSSEINPSRVCCLQDLSLGVLLVKPTRSCSTVVWNAEVAVLALACRGRDSSACHCQMLSLHGPGLPLWSYLPSNP